MKPINFKEANRDVEGSSMIHEVEPMPAYSDGNLNISCWKTTFAERLKILITGKIWLGVKSENLPPTFIIAEIPFYRKKQNKSFLRTYSDKAVISLADTLEAFVYASKQSDKRKHFIAGFIISLIIGICVPYAGILFAVIAGIIKEIRDKMGYGTPELLDFVFTVLGGIIALPVSILLNNLIF